MQIIVMLFLSILAMTDVTAATVRNGRINTQNVSNVRAAKTPQNTKQKNVVARAATTQSVIATGTKVETAAKNTILSECQEKYNGCMDLFCMPDNANGGRCICSNDIFKFDALLSEIEDLDVKSYQLATVGVQSIETGVDIAAQKRGINSKQKQQNALVASVSGSSLDLPEISVDKSGRGMELYKIGHDACIERMPECSTQIETLTLMYNQQIKSDCRAYENALKQSKIASQQKLNSTRSSLRSAALEQYQNANKYDLGQCTIEFRKCMQTTGGCGEDFAGCASMIAMDKTNSATRRVSARNAAQSYKINGISTSIEIAATTYDNLLSKKTLCDSVTNNCERVASSVWETFLRESAPMIKNAELIAENKVRQDCVVNISDCFQKACRDNIDPNDKDGSYDMCLTRPTTMLNVCKVPLNACGIDATSAETAEQSDIWEYVVARLAAMRVDSCTNEVKECLTADDRCGNDYTNCIGLDTDTIVRMCPYDKLVGCQSVYGDTDIRGNAVYDSIANMVQGIFINIDNNFMDECQKAVDEAMIRVCGTTENCDNLILTEKSGANSLEYGICEYGFAENGDLQLALDGCRKNTQQITDKELGRVEGSTSGELGPVKNFAAKMDGIIYWEGVGIQSDGRLMDSNDYLAQTDTSVLSEQAKKRILSEIDQLSKSVDMVINTIESDPTVQYCMTGRQVQGMNQTLIGHPNAARFPNLTKQTRSIISNSALNIAKENYFEKYDELSTQMLRDYGEIAERMAKIKGENAKDARRESARKACVSLADMSSIPKSPPPPPGWGGIFFTALAIAIATAVVCVFTFGAGGIAVAAGASAALGASTTGGTAAATAATTVAAAAASGGAAAGTAAATAAGFVSGIAASMGTAAATAISTSLALSTSIAISAGALGGIAALAGGIATGINAANPNEDGGITVSERELSGRHELDQWNFKEIITTSFDWDNLTCHRCIESRNCNKSKSPMFGDKYCSEWGEKESKCDDVQF